MNLPFNESIIIIPTYNEIENIAMMLSAIFELYHEISILIIDDASPDGTGQVVRKAMKNYSNLFMIERDQKLGIGTAYVAGFNFALHRNFNYIFGMDCDFSHNPEDVKHLLKAAMDHDLVIGSRYISGGKVINWPLARLLLSRIASSYSRFVTSIPLYDTTGGFKCFTRKTLEAVNLESLISKGYIFQLELNYIIWTSGMNIREIPIVFYERKKGKSKMGAKIIIEALFNVLVFKFKRLWDESSLQSKF